MFNSLIKPIYVLMNKIKNQGEMHEDSIVWRDFLFDVVPAERLSQSLRRAISKKTGSFAPNFFDIKDAWFEIAAEERETAKIQELKTNPAAACVGAKYHVGNSTETVLMNPHTQEDELYPCPKCRMEDFENKKKTDIALYGEIKPMIILEKMVEAEKPTIEVEKISAEEISELLEKHNSLIEKLIPESERHHFILIYDEGAECFARQNFRARTFTPQTVRKMIEDYRKL